MQPKVLAKKIVTFALSKKAHNVIVMDLRKLTDVADYFVVCSADSDTQVKAIADAVADGTEQVGVRVWRREGVTQRQWVLLDYVDVVVHVFHKEVRKYYNLEKLWGDAVIQAIDDVELSRGKRADRKLVRKPRISRKVKLVS